MLVHEGEISQGDWNHSSTNAYRQALTNHHPYIQTPEARKDQQRVATNKPHNKKI